MNGGIRQTPEIGMANIPQRTDMNPSPQRFGYVNAILSLLMALLVGGFFILR